MPVTLHEPWSVFFEFDALTTAWLRVGLGACLLS